jgi:hypothetical protein
MLAAPLPHHIASPQDDTCWPHRPPGARVGHFGQYAAAIKGKGLKVRKSLLKMSGFIHMRRVCLCKNKETMQKLHFNQEMAQPSMCPKCNTAGRYKHSRSFYAVHGGDPASESRRARMHKSCVVRDDARLAPSFGRAVHPSRPLVSFRQRPCQTCLSSALMSACEALPPTHCRG